MYDCNNWRRAADFMAPLGLAMLAMGLVACSREAPPHPAWDFARLDATGAEMAQDVALQHSCVRDGRTGLLWEVKQAEPGLHYQNDLYTWYSSDASSNGGEPGVADGGRCGLPPCDTESFVEAVNAAGLCGRNDWRMPSRDELLTLVDQRRIGKGPTMDPDYFPGTVAAEYWAGTSFTMYPQGAWVVDTMYAHDRVDGKTEAKRVRLVSGSKTAVRPKGRGR